MPAIEERSVIQDLVLLWIVRHGGEWPDWNGDLVAISMIGSLAGRLANKGLGKQIQSLLQQHVRVE